MVLCNGKSPIGGIILPRNAYTLALIYALQASMEERQCWWITQMNVQVIWVKMVSMFVKLLTAFGMNHISARFIFIANPDELCGEFFCH